MLFRLSLTFAGFVLLYLVWPRLINNDPLSRINRLLVPKLPEHLRKPLTQADVERLATIHLDKYPELWRTGRSMEIHDCLHALLNVPPTPEGKRIMIQLQQRYLLLDYDPIFAIMIFCNGHVLTFWDWLTGKVVEDIDRYVQLADIDVYLAEKEAIYQARRAG